MTATEHAVLGLQLALDNAPPVIRPQIEAAIRHIKRQDAMIGGLRGEVASARLYANEQYMRVRLALPAASVEPYGQAGGDVHSTN
mgnify:CR=1 FL=1